MVTGTPEFSEVCGGICIFDDDDFAGTTTGCTRICKKEVPQREQNIDSSLIRVVPHFGHFTNISGILGRRAPHLLQKSEPKSTGFPQFEQYIDSCCSCGVTDATGIILFSSSAIH